MLKKFTPAVSLATAISAFAGLSLLSPSKSKRRRAYPRPQCSPPEVIQAWNSAVIERGAERRERREQRAIQRKNLALRAAVKPYKMKREVLVAV